ncbi:MAG: Yip1 family protein [Caldilinea sp.]
MSNELTEIAVDPDRESVPSVDDSDKKNAPRPGVLTLLGRALLLGAEPYAVVRDDATPGRRGFVIILSIVGLVMLAQIVGYWLGWLTAPQLGSLQSLSYATIVDLPWYAQQVQLDPAFAMQFQQGHTVAWEALRILLGYPTITATATSIVVLFIATLLNWFVFAVLAHWFAHWYGGQARFGQTLGVLGLAYAPLLLRVLEVVPGAIVPVGLIFFLLLATKFLAIQSAHGLGSVQTLFVVLAPYVVVALVAMLVMLYGGAYGLQQIPYFNQALQVQQFLAQ